MSAPLSTENGRQGAGITSVLLVEDEQSIAEPFAQALARNGFQPMIARTAAEALRLGREQHLDIVLLDLTLPDGDGRDMCRELRRISTSRSSCSPREAPSPTESWAWSSGPTTTSSSRSPPAR